MNASTRSWWAQAMQNKLVAVVLAMVVIVPLIATPANPMLHGASALALEAFAVVLLAMMAFRARWDLRKEQVSNFLKTGPNAAVLLFAGVAGASLLLTSNLAAGAQEVLRTIAGVLLYFVVAYQFRRSEHLSKLVDTLLFVGIMAALSAFAIYSLGDTTRAAGLFGNAQMLASFLLILLPVIAVFALKDASLTRQTVAQVAVVLMSAALLITQTRTAWISAAAAVAAVAALTVMVGLKNRGVKPAANRAALALPAVLVVMSLGLFLLMWPQTQQLVLRGSTLGNTGSQSTWVSRQKMYQGAWAMGMQNPLTGEGVGAYPYAQQQYTQYGTTLMGGTLAPSLAENAHNLYLQIFAELGFPGLILFVCIPLGFLITACRKVGSMDSGLRRSLIIGCAGAIVGFMVDAMASPSWQLSQNSMFFWLVLGLGVGALRNPARVAKVSAQPALPQYKLGKALALACSLGLAALLPTFTMAAGDGYPDHIEIAPKTSTIRGGQLQAYTVTLVFTNSSTTNVTLSPKTTYSEDGLGAMTGANKSLYQSRPRRPETVNVTATYVDGSFSDTDGATLTVTN